MTPYELAQIRIKCAEIFISTCSKLDMTKDSALEKGEQLFWKVLKDVFVVKQDKLA